MQPYFLPYIGYFQLMSAVDEFVVYDNIQFSKKGWIQRNRMLQNGADAYFSLPLKKDSDFLDIRDRYLIDDWSGEREKLLRKIKANYQKAPFFSITMPVIENIFGFNQTNLFDFILNSIQEVCSFLDIQTKITVSSTIDMDSQLKSQDRVIETVKKLNGAIYINPIGGLTLYNPSDFSQNGLELLFHKSEAIEYPQFNQPFVPWLSILDVMMFNDKIQIKKWLRAFEIIRKHG